MKKVFSFIMAILMLIFMFACDKETVSKTDEISKPFQGSDSINSSNDDSQIHNTQDNTSQQDNSEDYNSDDREYSTGPTEEIRVKGLALPGTENWSTEANATILTVDNETTHTMDYFGWYITEGTNEMYMQMTTEEKSKFLDYVFNEQKCNMISFLLDTKLYHQSELSGYDISYFRDLWHIGEGSLLEEAIKRGITLYMCPTIGVPAYMKGDNIYSPYSEKMFVSGALDPAYTDAYARMIANMVYDLYTELGIKISFVATSDEPDFGTMAVEQLASVIKSLRKYLDKMGLKTVKIISCETTNFAPSWYKYLRSDKECWDSLAGFSGHDFTTGNVSEKLADMAFADGKYVLSTSSGILDEVTVAADCLEYSEDGTPIINDYFTAVRNMSSYLNDINMCLGAYVSWLPMTDIRSFADLDSRAPNFYHIFYNPGGQQLGESLVISANFNYYAQAIQTIQPGAAIFPCSTDKDGRMSGSFTDCRMNASAGINKDGTWGINILNKTDSIFGYNYDFKTIPAETITVNLDIVGLYGSGIQIFDIFSCATDGTAQEVVGQMTLVNGRGYVEVYPFEMVSLRSKAQIGIVNGIENENVSKNANIIYAGYKFAFIDDKKVNLISPPQLTSADKFEGTLICLKDLATVMGADYERRGSKVYIYSGDSNIIFTVGDSLVDYMGEIEGALRLNISTYEENGEVYALISEQCATAINSAFDIYFKMYWATGLIVIYPSGEAPENPVVNLYRFTKLFK